MSKKLLLLTSVLLSGYAAQAQYNMGVSTGNYSGLNSAYLNPAALADGKYKLYVDIVGMNAGIDNNLGKLESLSKVIDFANDDNANVNSVFKFSNKENFSLLAPYAELRGPSVIYALNRKHTFAFTTRARVFNQFNNFNQTLVAGTETCFCTQGLYHPLISTPIAYDITLDRGKNFMILTGANMSGKTTFMRAMGVGAMLAHLGMGVPAQYMKISFMEGVITNMHVEDNILKGESYFFAEVQRMKQTAAKLLQPNTHLVLMDELFKGTNVHDACECTKAVVEGLLKHKEHLMVLSTHLYEVAHQFADNSNISFAYFETLMDDTGSYNFTYTLKQGISNDRIGYKILLKEGVIDLLKS